MSGTDIMPRDGNITAPHSTNPNDFVFLTEVVATAWLLSEELADDAIMRGLVDVHFEECRNTSQMVKKGTRITLWSEDLTECFHTTA